MGPKPYAPIFRPSSRREERKTERAREKGAKKKKKKCFRIFGFIKIVLRDACVFRRRTPHYNYARRSRSRSRSRRRGAPQTRPVLFNRNFIRGGRGWPLAAAESLAAADFFEGSRFKRSRGSRLSFVGIRWRRRRRERNADRFFCLSLSRDTTFTNRHVLRLFFSFPSLKTIVLKKIKHLQGAPGPYFERGATEAANFFVRRIYQNFIRSLIAHGIILIIL